MLSATINQSTRLITDGIYADEHFEVIDKKDREAIDMDTYNEQIFNSQMVQLNANRELMQKQASDTQLELKNRRDRLKARELKEQQMQDDRAWNGLKDDWYWGSYSSDVSKTSYSELDNYTEKLKNDSYIPVKISNEYQPIGEFIQNQNPVAGVANKNFIYKSPIGDYTYDVKYDRLFPANSSQNTSNPVEFKNESDKINQLFNMKHKITPSSTPTPTETTEGFIDSSNVDPKLIEIYQKTLTPSEYVNKNTVSYDVEYSYNYLYVLIAVIILFLLFKH